MAVAGGFEDDLAPYPGSPCLQAGVIHFIAFSHAGALWRRGNSVSFFFQAEDGIRDLGVTGVQTCALPISRFLSNTRPASTITWPAMALTKVGAALSIRSEEHTSELQSRQYLVCSLLL